MPGIVGNSPGKPVPGGTVAFGFTTPGNVFVNPGKRLVKPANRFEKKMLLFVLVKRLLRPRFVGGGVAACAPWATINAQRKIGRNKGFRLTSGRIFEYYLNGGPTGIRTQNQRIMSPLL